MAAAFCKMHELLYQLPLKSYNNQLRSALQKANISKIAFLRHGNTAPSTTGHDFDRRLTNLGREQAQQAALAFGYDLRPFFSPLLVSPAPRTMETAEILLAAANETTRLQPIPTFYDGTMQPKGSVLFQKLGYAPLMDYLDNENDQERLDARDVLSAYAHSVVESIVETVTEASPISPSSPSTTLWLVGHAIYLPAAALGVASLVGCQDVSAILSTNTREAEGYLLDLSRLSAEYLSREARQ
jgi:hypothetical protein